MSQIRWNAKQAQQDIAGVISDGTIHLKALLTRRLGDGGSKSQPERGSGSGVPPPPRPPGPGGGKGATPFGIETADGTKVMRLDSIETLLEPL